MTDLAWVPQIRQAHLALVALSGTLFALRGAAAIAGARWSSLAPLRYASYLIDTALLAAALLLLAMLRINPLAEAWLAVKLALLPAYVVLGVMALRRARSQTGRGPSPPPTDRRSRSTQTTSCSWGTARAD